MWNPNSLVRSRFLQCLFGAVSLVSSACGGSTSGSGPTCEHGGRSYEPGQMIDDACGGCLCADDGSLLCAAIACPEDVPDPEGSCEVGGIVYPDGATIPDDCGGCQCQGGQVNCSLLLCDPGPAENSCELAFDAGNCDAYFPVFWHNPETGECEEAVYGGCGGNENRYESLALCEASCLGEEEIQQSCVVGEITYPHGASGVPDPGSCNTCSCNDGSITGCTKLNCPVACEDGLEIGSECAECRPDGACLAMRTGCLPVCDSPDECDGPGAACTDGLCRSNCDSNTSTP